MNDLVSFAERMDCATQSTKRSISKDTLKENTLEGKKERRLDQTDS